MQHRSLRHFQMYSVAKHQVDRFFRNLILKVMLQDYRLHLEMICMYIVFVRLNKCKFIIKSKETKMILLLKT